MNLFNALLLYGKTPSLSRQKTTLFHSNNKQNDSFDTVLQKFLLPTSGQNKEIVSILRDKKPMKRYISLEAKQSFMVIQGKNILKKDEKIASLKQKEKPFNEKIMRQATRVHNSNIQSQKEEKLLKEEIEEGVEFYPSNGMRGYAQNSISKQKVSTASLNEKMMRQSKRVHNSNIQGQKEEKLLKEEIEEGVEFYPSNGMRGYAQNSISKQKVSTASNLKVAADDLMKQNMKAEHTKRDSIEKEGSIHVLDKHLYRDKKRFKDEHATLKREKVSTKSAKANHIRTNISIHLQQRDKELIRERQDESINFNQVHSKMEQKDILQKGSLIKAENLQDDMNSFGESSQNFSENGESFEGSYDATNFIDQEGAKEHIIEHNNFEQIKEKFRRLSFSIKFDNTHINILKTSNNLYINFISSLPVEYNEDLQNFIDSVMKESGFEKYKVTLKDRTKKYEFYSPNRLEKSKSKDNGINVKV